MSYPPWGELFLSRLQHLEETKTGREWTAYCPAHENDGRRHRPSLSISYNGERLLVCCFAGCVQDAITSAVGLDWRALVPPLAQNVPTAPRNSHVRPQRPARATSGNAPPPKRERNPESKQIAHYDYQDEQGELLYQVIRNEPAMFATDGEGYAKKDFSQRRPGRGGWIYKLGDVRRVLYRLPEVHKAIQGGHTICLVEGEKDADNLCAVGLVATSNAGGAAKWREEYSHTLSGADVVILPDNDAPGRKHRDTAGASLQGVAKRVRVLELPGLPEHGDVSDWLQAGGTAEELCRLMEAAPDWSPPTAPDQGQEGEPSTEEEKRKSTTAEQLLKLAIEQATFFLSERDEPFARVPAGSGHANLVLRGKAFKEWLSWRFYQETSKMPNTEAMQSAVQLLSGKARFEGGAKRPLAVRMAQDDDGALWYDMGGPHWNAVRITSAGWQVIEDAPCLFRRYAATSEQATPQPGGSLEGLREVLNLSDEADRAAWRLLVVWLVSAMFPNIPHPVLHLQGEQGAAKSSAARMLSDLVDPSRAALRTEPRDAREWVQAADHGWMVTLDNVSKLPLWLSDAMCRAVTGEADTRRALFTDDDDVLIEFRRVICLTSIEEVITKSDLRDRTLLLPLTPITEEMRRTEADLRARWERLRPALFGALLDLTSAVLRILPSVTLTRMPRMADFALIGVAVEKALAWPDGAFLDAYADNQNAHHVTAIEADTVASLTIGFLRERDEAGRVRGAFEGTATELLAALRDFDARTKQGKKATEGMPVAAHKLTGRLQRVSPNLRAAGVSIEFRRSGKTGRTVHLAIEEDADPSPFQPLPECGGKQASLASLASLQSQKGVTLEENQASLAFDQASHGRVSDASGSTGDAWVTLVGGPSVTPIPFSKQAKNGLGDACDASLPLHSGKASEELTNRILYRLQSGQKLAVETFHRELSGNGVTPADVGTALGALMEASKILPTRDSHGREAYMLAGASKR